MIQRAESFLDGLKSKIGETPFYDPVSFDEETALPRAAEIISSGRAILVPYHRVYGITVDPFATVPSGINIDTFGMCWPDFLLKFLKADLDSVKNVSDLNNQLSVRQMPPVQVDALELIPYFDFSKIPSFLHKIFQSPEGLSAFNSLAFLRTPMLPSVINKGFLPEYLFSRLSEGTPVLQWIDFTKHPEAGELQRHIINNFISARYPNNIPALALTSANISKITPESIDPATADIFWNQGNNLRRLLMPLLIHNSSNLNSRSAEGSFSKTGSYPIFEIGEKGLVGWREGNIPLNIQKKLFSELNIQHPVNIKMHNYPHPNLPSAALGVFESKLLLNQKANYLHLLSLGYSHDICLECVLQGIFPEQLLGSALE